MIQYRDVFVYIYIAGMFTCWCSLITVLFSTKFKASLLKLSVVYVMAALIFIAASPSGVQR